MGLLAQGLALVLSAGGLLCLLAAAAGRAPWRHALGMMLDLWTGAGLLRLTWERAPWKAIAGVAVLVAARHLLVWGGRGGALRGSRPGRAPRASPLPSGATGRREG